MNPTVIATESNTPNVPLSLNVRFTITHCLTLVLVVALSMGLLTNHFRHKRQVQTLRDAIDDSRSILHTIEYGAANLRLLELNPAIGEDRDCSRFLKHQLAFSILDHWRDENAIDNVVGTPGYAIDFAADAFSLLQCKSADDFVKLAKTELWVYPGDGLRHSVYELSESELASFDEFIRTATTPKPPDGG